VFSIRLLLAATLGANYGIYGPAFELMEHEPVRSGSEEYLNSEKYEIRHWNLEQPETIAPLIARVNAIRNENAALQNDWSVRFHSTENDQIISYSKESDDGSNLILTVVNLDPKNTQAGMVTLPLNELGIPEDRGYDVEDLLTGARYLWNGPRNFVELNPTRMQGHILRIHHSQKRESESDYSL
jgi:starch synthase (maltosyl-transferring)